MYRCGSVVSIISFSVSDIRRTQGLAMFTGDMATSILIDIANNKIKYTRMTLSTSYNNVNLFDAQHVLAYFKNKVKHILKKDSVSLTTYICGSAHGNTFNLNQLNANCDNVAGLLQIINNLTSL